jgi:hypothetical protein
MKRVNPERRKHTLFTSSSMLRNRKTREKDIAAIDTINTIHCIFQSMYLSIMASMPMNVCPLQTYLRAHWVQLTPDTQTSPSACPVHFGGWTYYPPK